MKTVLSKVVLLAMLTACSGLARANHGPSIADRLTQVAVGIAPEVAAPAPKAVVQYRSGWSSASGTGGYGAHVHYCVFPSIRTIGRQDPNGATRGQTQAPWTLPFDLVLVNASGAPVAGPVTVPTPIPANTTIELLPPPGWCGEVSGITTPPELYLQVDGRRARVIFETRPPKDAPR